MVDVRELREIGLPIDAIVKMKGVTGIGVAGRNEYAKNGRPPIWTAIKRAKTDFYKMAFPFIPGEQINPGVGLRRDADGAVRPDYTDAHWGNELSWEAQDEHEPSEFAQRLAKMPEAQFDAEIFGDGNASIELGTDVDEDGNIVEGSYEPAPRQEPADPGTYSDKFLTYCVENISRYTNIHAVRAALKKQYPTETGDRREQMTRFEWLKQHAAGRDAEEAGVDAKSEPLFDLEENGAYAE